MKTETAKEFIKRRSGCFRDVLSKYRKTPKDNLLKWLPDINRRGRYGSLREAWIFMPQHNIKGKIFIIERFKLVKIVGPITHKNLKAGNVEYRFGYYMLGKNGNRINRWTWGEACPIIPGKDLVKLINKARKEKVIL